MKLTRRNLMHGAGAIALSGSTRAAMAQDMPLAGDDLLVAGFSSPVEIGTRAQLLADGVLVHDTRNVSYTLHTAEKHPGNPILKADREWEGWRVVLYGDVIYDAKAKLFKMWYCAEAPDYFGSGSETSPVVIMYATSTDGVHWDKPPVGTLASTRKVPHNAVADAELASITVDESDPDPSRRYKMICFIMRPKESRGYHTMVSADGINWKRLSRTPIAAGSDVITGYHDDRLGCYVALGKIMTMVRGQRRRVFYLITSKDFENWTKPRLVWSPDERDDAGSLRRIAEVRAQLSVPDDPKLMRTEFYGFGFYPTESSTVAFPWMFTINNNVRFGNQEGPGELQIGFSRDLVNWHRPFRVPAVTRGAAGEWDSGFFCTQARALRVGDEVWLYYCGSTYTHGTDAIYRRDDPERGHKYTAGIGLAQWKLDRFVSADGVGPESSLTTVPVRIAGRRLELNANVKPGGSLRVTIQDEAGARTLLGPSEPVRGDSLRHTVKWAGSTSIDQLQGRPVTLQFSLAGAELFTFAFRPS